MRKRKPTRLMSLCALIGFLCAGTLWQDHKKLRLVCFWKRVHSEAEAKSTIFPAANRKDVAYEYQEVMKRADISAHFFWQISPTIELMVESLLQDDGYDLGLVTTRLSLKDIGRAFGDNHDVKRNGSGQNFVRVNQNRPDERPEYVSYNCGVYELPLPTQPRMSPGLEPREPPIH